MCVYIYIHIYVYIYKIHIPGLSLRYMYISETILVNPSADQSTLSGRPWGLPGLSLIILAKLPSLPPTSLNSNEYSLLNKYFRHTTSNQSFELMLIHMWVQIPLPISIQHQGRLHSSKSWWSLHIAPCLACVFTSSWNAFFFFSSSTGLTPTHLQNLAQATPFFF